MLLTEQEAGDSSVAFQFEGIEENLQHTRKIPRRGIRTPTDVKVALAPLLAIANQSGPAEESFDDRLRKKLDVELGLEATASFLGAADDETVARTLAEKAE